MRFIADVTNTRDKECLLDVTKVLITSKTILTESELETVQNSTYLSTTQNNSVYGCILCKHYYISVYLNGFVNSALPL